MDIKTSFVYFLSKVLIPNSTLPSASDQNFALNKNVQWILMKILTEHNWNIFHTSLFQMNPKSKFLPQSIAIRIYKSVNLLCSITTAKGGFVFLIRGQNFERQQTDVRV